MSGGKRRDGARLHTWTVLALTIRRDVCRSCAAPLVFAQSAETLKWLPIDPNYETLETWNDFGTSRRLARLRGVSHFATCPHADTWRRR